MTNRIPAKFCAECCCSWNKHHHYCMAMVHGEGRCIYPDVQAAVRRWEMVRRKL